MLYPLSYGGECRRPDRWAVADFSVLTRPRRQ
jgi:hypothetical protein